MALSGEREEIDYPCGLPDVRLFGVPAWVCPACGEREVEIPNVEGLHRAIKQGIVVKHGPLTGEEVRFLRSWLGWSGVEAATMIGVAGATLSRWERNTQRITRPHEILLRMYARFLEPRKKYADLHTREAREDTDDAPSNPARHMHLDATDNWALPAK